MRTGFLITYKTRKGESKQEIAETGTQASRRIAELKAAGNRKIKVEQCIY